MTMATVAAMTSVRTDSPIMSPSLSSELSPELLLTGERGVLEENVLEYTITINIRVYTLFHNAYI